VNKIQDMQRPLMPKATAIWLIRHTCLTWEQIGSFCQLHPLEISSLAECDSLHEQDPIAANQLALEEIKRCEADPSLSLTLKKADISVSKMRKQYVPLSKRADIPHAVFWMIKTYPHISDAKICTILPTTKNTVKSIRDGTYWNFKNLVQKDPVLLGLCAQDIIDSILPSEK
jgi:hypothetical protein